MDGNLETSSKSVTVVENLKASNVVEKENNTLLNKAWSKVSSLWRSNNGGKKLPVAGIAQNSIIYSGIEISECNDVNKQKYTFFGARENEKTKEESLKEITDEILGIVQSVDCFQKKMEKLDFIYDETVYPYPHDTCLENKIEGFKIAECMNYLRSIKAKIDYYRLYAEDFPFSKDLSLWGEKVNEICSLKKCLQEVPQSSQYLKQRIESIHDETTKVLKILDRKGKDNAKILHQLENLSEISTKINNLFHQGSTPFFEKLNKFNVFREEIGNSDKRLSKKKLEILHQLHGLEENLYEASYGEGVAKMKRTLNTHEKDIMLETSEENSEIKIQISKLYEDIKKNFPEVNPLRDNVETLLKLNTIRTIKNHEEDNVFPNTTINVESQLLQIKEELKKPDHKIDEIFSLKERLDDITTDNDDLNSQKQSLLETIINILENLDEDVAQFVRMQPKFEDILDLESHFSLNLEEIRYPRDSLEFIEEIGKRATYYENCIDHFFGKRSSIHYYVIYESLMRLLEELDKVKPDDQVMLDTKIRKINYIKSFIAKLKLHTFDN